MLKLESKFPKFKLHVSQLGMSLASPCITDPQKTSRLWEDATRLPNVLQMSAKCHGRNGWLSGKTWNFLRYLKESVIISWPYWKWKAPSFHCGENTEANLTTWHKILGDPETRVKRWTQSNWKSLELSQTQRGTFSRNFGLLLTLSSCTCLNKIITVCRYCRCANPLKVIHHSNVPRDQQEGKIWIITDLPQNRSLLSTLEFKKLQQFLCGATRQLHLAQDLIACILIGAIWDMFFKDLVWATWIKQWIKPSGYNLQPFNPVHVISLKKITSFSKAVAASVAGFFEQTDVTGIVADAGLLRSPSIKAELSNWRTPSSMVFTKMASSNLQAVKV